jgi:hypothetical protein
MIELTPTYDNSGGIRTDGGPFELYFSTITNLKARLWRAQIALRDTTQNCSNSAEETAPGLR